jgi:hypothetical protein
MYVRWCDTVSCLICAVCRYEEVRSAERAQVALNGREFGDAPIKAEFFDVALLEAGKLG